MRLRILIFILVLSAAAAAQNSPPIPKEYQELYSMLDQKVSSFDAKVSRAWDGKPADVAFAAELLTANCNRGRQLLDPRTFEAAKLELDRLQALGVKAVVVCIGFPLLYRPFFDFNRDPAGYQGFVDFYRRLAEEVHGRDMQLIVETSVLFGGFYSSGSGFDLPAYYRTLDAKALLEGRAQVARTIVREVKPDYLNLGSEPDTQARLTGFRDLATPEGNARQVAYLVKELRAAGTGRTRLGAGVGTWSWQADAHLRLLCASGVDFIDLHVYPVNREMLDRLIPLTDQAAACGKPVAISEAWLQKERDSELRQIDAAFDPEFYARDAFSFWAPLDQKFLLALVKFSHWKRVMYLSPFWSKLFWAYLDYGQAGGLPKEAVIQASNRAAAQAMQQGGRSPTGAAYKKAIAGAAQAGKHP